MNIKQWLKTVLLLTALIGTAIHANETTPDPAIIEVNTLLDNFLANSVQNDKLNHDSFWADDLIYTSSAGLRFGKADIMKSFNQQASESNETNEKPPVYWAENTDVRVYGNTAIVAFKLMHKENADTDEIKQTYFNTGTMVKRNGKWQVVAWQATKIPQATK
ncbi:nuclear transport factor 2 family protein [Colwellia sp. MEBiC06753]